MSQQIPLRERLAEILDPHAWSGWRALYAFSARNAEQEEDEELRQRILENAENFADATHGAAKHSSLQMADTIIELTSSGLLEMLKNAPSPSEMGSPEGQARYREWHATFSGLDLEKLGTSTDILPPAPSNVRLPQVNEEAPQP